LSRDPLAFADHAAEFYLGPGADPERAWVLAQQNLANRQTPRAAALAIKAAEASGRYADACALLRKYPDSVKSVQLQIWSPDPKIGSSVRPLGGKDACFGGYVQPIAEGRNDHLTYRDSRFMPS
jgi:hypothetical protein